MPKFRKKSWLIAGTICTITASLLTFWLGKQSGVTGIISTFAFLPLALALPDSIFKEENGKAGKLVFLAALFFLGLMILFWPATGGKQWGARYWLPAYPLLLYLAGFVYTYLTRNLPASYQTTLKQMGAAMLCGGLIIQLASLSVLKREIYSSNTIREAIAEMPAQIILTNGPFLPSQALPGNDKIFMYVNDPADIEKLVPRFYEQGIDQFAFIPLEIIPLEMPEQVGRHQLEEFSPFHYRITQNKN